MPVCVSAMQQQQEGGLLQTTILFARNKIYTQLKTLQSEENWEPWTEVNFSLRTFVLLAIELKNIILQL